MKKKFPPAATLLSLTLIGLLSLTVSASPLTAEELSKMAGLFDPLKIYLEEDHLDLQIEIYRGENPVLWEKADPDLRVQPKKIIPIGKMVLHSSPDEEIYMALILQRLLIRGERQYLLHWGLGFEGEKSSGLAHSSYTIDISELSSPDYHWSLGPVTPAVLSPAQFTPIYLFRGIHKDREEIIFSGLHPNNPGYLAQMYDLLIVIAARH